MQSKNRKQTLFHDIEDRYHAEMKRLKRKKFLLKARLLLTIVLPFFIILLSVKVARTFIRIKVRDIFAKPEERNPKAGAAPETPVESAVSAISAVPAVSAEPAVQKEAEPVKFEAVEKEIISPSPVDDQKQGDRL